MAHRFWKALAYEYVHMHKRNALKTHAAHLHAQQLKIALPSLPLWNLTESRRKVTGLKENTCWFFSGGGALGMGGGWNSACAWLCSKFTYYQVLNYYLHLLLPDHDFKQIDAFCLHSCTFLHALPPKWPLALKWVLWLTALWHKKDLYWSSTYSVRYRANENYI